MSEETQWLVMQGEEQLGPYTGTQLVEFATNGNITPETLVWAEGMENWLPAGQVEGLFPAVAAEATSVATVPLATAQPPSADPAAGYPSPSVKNASFGLWAGMLLGGFALVIVGLMLLAVLGRNAAGGGNQEVTSGQAIGAVVAMALAGAGYLLSILSFIPFYMTIYRAWKCLQPGGLARTPPGKAIGFMFIPFFNIYWLFQAIYGLANDWNRTMDTYPDLKSAPRLSPGVFLTCCIGFFLQPLGLIMMFPVVSQMCKGVNFFAYRPHPGQGVFSGTGGGFQIGGGYTTH